MKFRRFTVFVILFIIVAILVIVLPKTDAEKIGINRYNAVTITYAYCHDGELESSLNELINKFNETEGKKVGIHVEPKYYGTVKYLSEIVNETIVGGLPNNRICDINTVSYETAYLAKTMNKIASPDDYLNEDVIDEYIRGFVERGRYSSDSKIGVFPLPNNTKVIYVNEVIWNKFKEAYPRYQDDVFDTWEGIAEVSVDYYDWTDSLTPDIEGDGKAFILIDNFTDYIFTGSNQLMGPIIQPGHREIRINLDRRTLQRLWDTVYSSFLYGGISIDNYDFANSTIKKNNLTGYDLMADGKIACYIDTTENVSKYPFAFYDNTGAKETKLKVFGFPTFKNGRPVSPIDGAGLIVMKSNNKKEYASYHFLNWLASQKKYIEICYKNMLMPVKRESISSVHAQGIIEEAINSKEIKKKYRGLVLEQASLQVLDDGAYAPVEFSKSEAFRKEITNSFYRSVDIGIKEFNNAINEGVERKEALKTSITEELFDKWYSSITEIANKY